MSYRPRLLCLAERTATIIKRIYLGNSKMINSFLLAIQKKTTSNRCKKSNSSIRLTLMISKYRLMLIQIKKAAKAWKSLCWKRNRRLIWRPLYRPDLLLSFRTCLNLMSQRTISSQLKARKKSQLRLKTTSSWLSWKNLNTKTSLCRNLLKSAWAVNQQIRTYSTKPMQHYIGKSQWKMMRASKENKWWKNALCWFPKSTSSSC